MVEVETATEIRPQTVEEVKAYLNTKFGAADYAVFISMLAICTFIGLYFGYVDYRKRKGMTKDANTEAADYLMGGRDMSIIPIALSLTASFVSGTVLLGTATEMYLYG
jgi:solute carrier family 5 (sodium-coupled monocarboxylate transporter), member 8/12